jgi:putative membrane protein
MPALLADWPFHPTIIAGVLLAAVLYWRGLSYSQSRGLVRHVPWWRAAAFAVALLVLLLALDSPLESLADSFLWAHMLQHELLTLGAAPLLLFSAPWLPLWRSVPLPARRSTLRWILRRRWPRRLWHQLTRVLWTPTVAWLLFAGVFSLWHIPALYDLALEREEVHTLEHALFLGTALIFWAQVIPSRPLHPRMSYPMQAIYLTTAALQSNVLGSLLVFSTGPIYTWYATQPRSASALPVLSDQHLAGATMDVFVTIVFFVAIVALLGYWLQEDERAPDPARRPAIANQ